MNEMTGLLQLRAQLHGLTENCQVYELLEADLEQDMNRMEAKFVMPVSHAKSLCQYLLGHCDCLLVSGSHVLGYNTVYFDTSNFQFYHHHHQKKPRRLKVRVRHYRETDTRFLEVKRKDKVGKTHKERVPVENMFPIREQQSFLQEQGVTPEHLISTLQVQYERISLKDRVNGERISFDFAIQFSDGQQATDIAHMAIVELKLPAHVHQARAFQEIKAMGFRETSISKYCIGMAHLFAGRVKYNRFKPELMKLGLMSSKLTQRSAQPSFSVNPLGVTP